MKGLFIVFEGIDGSGKSTQAALLRDYLFRRQCKAVITSEPSSGPIGNLIREGIQGRMIFSHDERRFQAQMAYLFAADRHDHLFNEVDGVVKLLRGGHTVISTRYSFSSLAYQCDNPEDFDFVRRLNEKFPNPDATIHIDNPVDVSIERMSHRSFTDRYERKEQLAKVRENYQSVFAKYDGVLLELDGTAPIKSVHRRIVAFMEQRFYRRFGIQGNKNRKSG